MVHSAPLSYESFLVATGGYTNLCSVIQKILRHITQVKRNMPSTDMNEQFVNAFANVESEEDRLRDIVNAQLLMVGTILIPIPQTF